MAISELIQFDGGMSTKTSPHLIARNEGIICQNVNLEIGTLKPISAFEYITNVDGKHIYYFQDTLISNVTTTDDRFYDEYAGRLYWTDMDYNSGLRKYDDYSSTSPAAWDVATAYVVGDTVTYGGFTWYCEQNGTGQTPIVGSAYWTHADNWGVTAQAPATLTPTEAGYITIGLHADDGGRLTHGADYVYAFTIVDSQGIESTPSLISANITWASAERLKMQLAISKANFTTITTNHPDMVGINLYRTGGDNPTFNLVAEQLNDTHQLVYSDATNWYFDDITADIDVSRIELTTFDNIPPPNNLDMLIELKGTFFGAWDNKVYFSQSGTPEFWGSLDYVALDKDCTGLGKFGDSVIAFTLTSAYLITGYNRDNISVQRLPFNQGCVNKHSVANIDAYTIWASMNGICLFDGSQIQVLTKQTLAWDEFGRLGNKMYQDYDGTTEKWDSGSGFNMQYAVGYQDKYYGVFNNGVMVLDLSNGIKVSTIYAENVAAVQYNYDDNFLYLVIDALDGTFDVYASFASGTPTTATWKTGRITDGTVNVRKHYRSVELDGTPQSVTVFVDGVQKYYVENKSKFMLPANLIGRDIQFEIVTVNEIRGMKYEYTQLKA